MPISKTKISEDELVKSFILSNKASQATGFKGELVEQLETLAGIPDIICISKKQMNEVSKMLVNFPAQVFTNGYATVVSQLSHRLFINKTKLFEATGLSQLHLKKVLVELKKLKIIQENQNGLFRLTKNFKLPRLEIWSMEFKLNNWRSAFKQSLRHRNFSTYAMVVMPFEKKEVLNKNKNLFLKFHIGAAVYDKKNDFFEFVVKPKKCGAISKKAQIDTVGRIMMLSS